MNRSVLTLEFCSGESQVFCHALILDVPDKHPQIKDFRRIQAMIASHPRTANGWKTISLAASNWDIVLTMLLLAEVRLRRELMLRTLRMKIRTLLHKYETKKPTDR
jgi:hypothetical protein